MPYDPFFRGPYPVGVRSHAVTDAARQRPLPIELWYPADEAVRGRDTRSDDARPLRAAARLPGRCRRRPCATPRRGRVATRWCYSRTAIGGHRRQSTFFCTHLASHGYVVAAVDHTGNTITDVMQAMLQIAGGARCRTSAGELGQFIALRPDDVVFLLDACSAGSTRRSRRSSTPPASA